MTDQNARSVNRIWIVRLLLSGYCLGFGFISNTVDAQTGHCCWRPENPPTLATTFEGTVVDVKEAEGQLVIKYQDHDVPFSFVESGGSAEQKALLKTLKEGDVVEGEKMMDKDLFHFMKK